MLDVKPGWRVADIGCGNGVLATEAALMGAQVDAIDISPAMLALAEIYARDRKASVRTQSAGLLSFSYQPESYDLIVSEFTLHHLPDFWKAVAMSRIYRALKPGASFYLRDIVYVSMPDAIDRDVEQWADFQTNNHDFSRERSWLLVDRKSTRLNSSHQIISYAVFCLKKKRRFASRRESR